jgi:hypothetical protein
MRKWNRLSDSAPCHFLHVHRCRTARGWGTCRRTGQAMGSMCEAGFEACGMPRAAANFGCSGTPNPRFQRANAQVRAGVELGCTPADWERVDGTVPVHKEAEFLGGVPPSERLIYSPRFGTRYASHPASPMPSTPCPVSRDAAQAFGSLVPVHVGCEFVWRAAKRTADNLAGLLGRGTPRTRPRRCLPGLA